MEFTEVASFLSLLFFIYFLLKLVRGNNDSSSEKEIPGPKKLPLIGNLHLLAGKSPPHHVFRDLAGQHGPLMRLQLGEVPFLIVSSADTAKQVLRTHDVTFANRIPLTTAPIFSYNLKDIVAAPYGEHWRHLRKICTFELLSSRRVKSFRHIREEENYSLAKCIASKEGSPVNLSEILYLNSFDIVTRSSVGNNIEERREITSVIDQILKLGSGLSIVDLYPSIRLLPIVTGVSFKVARLFRRMDRVLQSIVDRHRGDGEEGSRAADLVHVLLENQRNEAELPITNDAIKAVIMDMFFAGTETSSTVVSWAMSEMMRNPTTLKLAQDQVRQVFDDRKRFVDEGEFHNLKYLKLVIKETLRLHPPLPLLIPRMSSQECEINGYKVAAKTRVMINAWALARDPKIWSEAEIFKPERFADAAAADYNGNDFEYLPFGSGRRNCPGMFMGLVNVEYTLAMLLYHFDWEMPFGVRNEELDMREDFGATARKKLDLHLIPTVRRPLMQPN